MSTTYHVGIGGQPRDNEREYFDPRDALEEAYEIAIALAAEPGISTDTLGEYGGEGESEWGVCPDGDDGAYWPYIRTVSGGCGECSDCAHMLDDDAGMHCGIVDSLELLDADSKRCCEHAMV